MPAYVCRVDSPELQCRLPPHLIISRSCEVNSMASVKRFKLKEQLVLYSCVHRAAVMNKCKVVKR